MPKILVRDGKLISKQGSLATDECRECCDGGDDTLFMRVRDCCVPTLWYWILQTTLASDGTPLYTPGMPKTIQINEYCATVDPSVLLTAAQIQLIEPDANFLFFDQGGAPQRVENCLDPACRACPPCCVARQIPEGECGGPLCCEQGGSFLLDVDLSAIALRRERVFGAAGRCGPLECAIWSSEATTLRATSNVRLRLRYDCNESGVFTTTCLFASRTSNYQEFNITGPPECSGASEDFPPIVTPAFELSESLGCDDFANFDASQGFAMTRSQALALLNPFVFGAVAASGVPLFNQACLGSAARSEPVDRTWTTDPCEQRLSAIGNSQRGDSSWSGFVDCEGGTFIYQGSSAGTFTTRFWNGGYQRFLSSGFASINGSWSITRLGPSTCAEPQCSGSGEPGLVIQRRQGTPTAGVRGGCAGCGSGGGL